MLGWAPALRPARGIGVRRLRHWAFVLAVVGFSSPAIGAAGTAVAATSPPPPSVALPAAYPPAAPGALIAPAAPPAPAALATPTVSPIVGSGSVVSVTCPNVGQVAALLPPGAPGPAPPLVPPGVRIGVGFRATDARTGEAVGGGDGGRIECATVPFRELPAGQVFAGSLPPGVVADDLLSGTFTLSVTVDAATVTQAGGDRGRRARIAAAPFPFSAALRSYLDSRGGEVSVAVYDAAGGATYTLDPQGRFVTASIVKVAILVTLLRQAQDQSRGLSAWEQDTATSMIEYSDNGAATALWNEVGRGAGVAAFLALVGMPDTVPGGGGYWGLTQTSAADQVQLMRTVAYPNPVLDDAARGYVAGLMSNVTPSQRWGVSAGVPPEVPVAVKNGWLPVANGWEINSIGHVSGGLHDYVVAVLSVGSPSMDDGISTVEVVSSLVWSNLASVSAVDEHYAALGGAEGFMGQPTGPELGTPDGVGRYRGYQGGAIYWSPASGAYEVHGRIYDAWAAHGWEAGLLGYPVTDEFSTPDRLGRFTHFTNGSTYWTVAAGAHEVSRTRCTARSGRSGRRWAGRTARWDTQSPTSTTLPEGEPCRSKAARSLRRRRPAPTLSTATSIGGTDRSAGRTHCLVCQ